MTIHKRFTNWMTHRSGVTRLVLGGFLVGVGVVSYVSIQSDYIALIFVIGLLGMLIFLRSKIIRVVFLVILATAIGAAHYHWYVLSQHSPLEQFHEKTATVVGVIDDPIDSRIEHRNLTIAVESVDKKPVTGRLLVSVPLYPEYRFGDQLSLHCQLEKPEPIEDFSYDRYLALRDITTLCKRPEVKFLNHDALPRYQIIFDYLRTYVSTIPLQHLSEPIASLFVAMLLGTRSGLPTDLTAAFSATGTTHLIAISGMNMTIIIVVLQYILITFGMNRRYALWFVTPILIFYVILIGASASAVRAALMGWIVIATYCTGRLPTAGGILLLTASVMVIDNPLILRDDVGFQLSFLAVIGIMYAHEAVAKLFLWLPNPLGLREGFTMTLAAQLATMPILVYEFGRVSLIAPLVNIILVPLVAPVTIFGSGLLIIASLFPQVDIWWLPIELLLHFLISVVEYASRVPYAAFNL